jgi:hypothetical protein
LSVSTGQRDHLPRTIPCHLVVEHNGAQNALLKVVDNAPAEAVRPEVAAGGLGLQRRVEVLAWITQKSVMAVAEKKGGKPTVVQLPVAILGVGEAALVGANAVEAAGLDGLVDVLNATSLGGPLLGLGGAAGLVIKGGKDVNLGGLSRALLGEGRNGDEEGLDLVLDVVEGAVHLGTGDDGSTFVDKGAAELLDKRVDVIKREELVLASAGGEAGDGPLVIVDSVLLQVDVNELCATAAIEGSVDRLGRVEDARLDVVDAAGHMIVVHGLEDTAGGTRGAARSTVVGRGGPDGLVVGDSHVKMLVLEDVAGNIDRPGLVETHVGSRGGEVAKPHVSFIDEEERVSFDSLEKVSSHDVDQATLAVATVDNSTSVANEGKAKRQESLVEKHRE